MADKSKTNKKPKFGARIKKYFRDTWSEFKKIVWPSGKSVLNNTVVVLVTVLVFAVIVGVLDFALNWGRNTLIEWIVQWAGDANV